MELKEMHSTISILFMVVTLGKTQPLGYGGYELFGDQDLFSQQSSNYIPNFKSVGRERAILENESKLSQLDSAYSYAQGFAAGIYGTKPLVDTIEEREKYGNEGSRRITQPIVNALETVANIGNAIIDAPSNKIHYAGRTANAALNAVGAYLVGL